MRQLLHLTLPSNRVLWKNRRHRLPTRSNHPREASNTRFSHSMIQPAILQTQSSENSYRNLEFLAKASIVLSNINNTANKIHCPYDLLLFKAFQRMQYGTVVGTLARFNVLVIETVKQQFVLRLCFFHMSLVQDTVLLFNNGASTATVKQPVLQSSLVKNDSF